jgi:hypothetical protein
MPEENREFDIQIIRAAYAERIQDAFRVFAENIGMGQSEKNCTERFIRSMELIRKARDLALAALDNAAGPRAAAGDNAAGAATHAGATPGEAGGAQPAASGLEGLSAEDRAMVEQALSGTTGKAPLRIR